MPANQLVRNMAIFNTDLQACYYITADNLSIKVLAGSFLLYPGVLTRETV